MIEIWKDIKGFNNYQISNFGRVKRKEYKQIRNLKQGEVEVLLKEKILKTPIGLKYKHISLNRKTILIHKLVATHFIGKRPDGYVIDHIDNNPLNNNVNNLTYTTYFINSTKDRTFNNKVRGVHFCKTTNKWVCRVNINKKRIYLGSFDKESDAIKIIKQYDRT